MIVSKLDELLALRAADGTIRVDGDLRIAGTGITALPEGLSVGHSLYLYGCTGITALPEGLSVGHSLYLYGCTGITALPEGLSVGGGLHLDPQRIANVAHKDNCGNHNRTIYAAWVNMQACISAGCFFGPLNEFFDAVDVKYSGDAAKKYKADAQDCVNRLVKLMEAA